MRRLTATLCSILSVGIISQGTRIVDHYERKAAAQERYRVEQVARVAQEVKRLQERYCAQGGCMIARYAEPHEIGIRGATLVYTTRELLENRSTSQGKPWERLDWWQYQSLPEDLQAMIFKKQRAQYPQAMDKRFWEAADIEDWAGIPAMVRTQAYFAMIDDVASNYDHPWNVRRLQRAILLQESYASLLYCKSTYKGNTDWGLYQISEHTIRSLSKTRGFAGFSVRDALHPYKATKAAAHLLHENLQHGEALAIMAYNVGTRDALRARRGHGKRRERAQEYLQSVRERQLALADAENYSTPLAIIMDAVKQTSFSSF
jgi:hypothetical protein